MGDRIKVFFLEPTDREHRWLRRYVSSSAHTCEKTGSYCDGMVDFGESDILYTADGYISDRDRDKPPASDPRWPARCAACGRPFGPGDPYQLFGRQIHVHLGTGLRCALDDAPPGACWNAWWIGHRTKDEPEHPVGCGHNIGPDGRSLIVRCPDGHDWLIDSRAANCTRKDDNAHFCWVRHGRPEDGTLHVDKNGNTCSAGAGSIQTQAWHGFLHHGELHT